MSAYLITSAITYQGGFLDSTIDGFHDSFGFSSFGRPASSRNDVNVIFDLKSSQTALLEPAWPTFPSPSCSDERRHPMITQTTLAVPAKVRQECAPVV